MPSQEFSRIGVVLENGFTGPDLEKALDAVASMLHKLVKSKDTMEAKGSIRAGSSQQTLIDRRIAALKICQRLIRRELADEEVWEDEAADNG